jgi:hypothetical protein
MRFRHTNWCRMHYSNRSSFVSDPFGFARAAVAPLAMIQRWSEHRRVGIQLAERATDAKRPEASAVQRL